MMTEMEKKRQEKGYTQQLMAENIDVSVGCYNMYENNQRKKCNSIIYSIQLLFCSLFTFIQFALPSLFHSASLLNLTLLFSPISHSFKISISSFLTKAHTTSSRIQRTTSTSKEHTQNSTMSSL